MSWIFGYISRTESLITPNVSSLYEINTSDLKIICGGNMKTAFHIEDGNDTDWIVIGVGIYSGSDNYTLMKHEHWKNILINDEGKIPKINGHYVIVKYSSGSISLFTDPLGLRDIYVAKLKDGFGFTTRIDWLKYFLKPELDLNQLGPRWLLYNQISDESIIKNVTRLAGKNAEIKNGELILTKSTLVGLENTGNKKVFSETLKKLICNSENKISLSLSGGIDSRLLLSFLLLSNNKNWNTHTFGSLKHPDAVIAKKISVMMKFEHNLIYDELPNKDKLINILKNYSASAIVTNPASSITNLRFYKFFSDELIIDGGFGEIWRRQFANRLRFFGSNAIKTKDLQKILLMLNHKKSDFFNNDVLNQMRKGAIDQIEEILDELPPLSKNLSMSNWVDLFSIKTRLKNYYGPEQSRIDNYAISFMPLAQKELLSDFYLQEKRTITNSKLFRNLIKKNCAELKKIPLVKGAITIPFNYSIGTAKLFSAVKTRFGNKYIDEEKISLFNSIHEYILDNLNSAEVTQNELYDKNKLKRIENNFSTDQNNYSEVDWFFAFELFREGIV